MEKFGQWKTSSRITLSSAAMIMLVVGLVAASMVRMRELTHEIDAIAMSRVPKIIVSARAVESLLQGSRSMRNALILDEESEIRIELAGVARASSQAREALQQLSRMLTHDTERTFLKSIEEAQAAYTPLEEQFVARAQKGDYSGAKDLMNQKVRQAEGRYIDAIGELIEFESASNDSETFFAKQTQERAQETIAAIVGITALGVLAAIVGTFFIVRSLRRRIGENSYVAQIANSIAGGDLRMAVETREGDEAAILRAMKKMRDDLAHAVGSIRLSAGEVGTAANQIAQGNLQLSSRTEEQASSLEETAASMEELAGTVKQNSESARQANELALNASRRAELGGAEVGIVVETMNDISRSANRIAEIISVIDSIAFQTNILALNAAVEAARAGEQGRGFAVVASEVRSLAQRSSQASKEIKDLIGASVEQVGRGAIAVEKAGSTIGALVADVKNVSDLMRAIADASQEQARGVDQVNRTVTEMDKVVQHNASAVQQSVAATEAMRAQAEGLLQAVSAFRIENEEAPAPAPVAEPRTERVQRPGSMEAFFTPKPALARPTASRTPALAGVGAAGEDWSEF